MDQFRDPAFWHTYDKGLVCHNGEIPQLTQAMQLPCFQVRNDLLYQTAKGKGPGQEASQLQMPQQYRAFLISLAYDELMGVHLDTDNTEAHLLQWFF